VVNEVADFFLSYAAAFERRDVPAICALYAFPAHVASDVGEEVRLLAIPSAEAFVAPLGGLLEMYRRVGCKRIRVLDLDVESLSARLCRAVVQWGLCGLADLPLYDFTASYVLARFEHHWRVVSAVSHDELKAYRGFIGR
jgi:hypothetical protein